MIKIIKNIIKKREYKKEIQQLERQICELEDKVFKMKRLNEKLVVEVEELHLEIKKKQDIINKTNGYWKSRMKRVNSA